MNSENLSTKHSQSDSNSTTSSLNATVHNATANSKEIPQNSNIIPVFKTHLVNTKILLPQQYWNAIFEYLSISTDVLAIRILNKQWNEFILKYLSTTLEKDKTALPSLKANANAQLLQLPDKFPVFTRDIEEIRIKMMQFLSSVGIAEIRLVKSYSKPPPGVRDILDACHLLVATPAEKEDSSEYQNSWRYCMMHLANPQNYMDRCKKVEPIDIMKVSESVLQDLDRQVEKMKETLPRMKNISSFVEAMGEWLKTFYDSRIFFKKHYEETEVLLLPWKLKLHGESLVELEKQLPKMIANVKN